MRPEDRSSGRAAAHGAGSPGGPGCRCARPRDSAGRGELQRNLLFHLAQRLGHGTPQTTLASYIHVPEMLAFCEALSMRYRLPKDALVPVFGGHSDSYRQIDRLALKGHAPARGPAVIGVDPEARQDTQVTIDAERLWVRRARRLPASALRAGRGAKDPLQARPKADGAGAAALPRATQVLVRHAGDAGAGIRLPCRAGTRDRERGDRQARAGRARDHRGRPRRPQCPLSRHRGRRPAHALGGAGERGGVVVGVARRQTVNHPRTLPALLTCLVQ